MTAHSIDVTHPTFEPLDSIKVLQLGIQALLRQQAEEGSWEGEVVWCPLLAAQYALMSYITQVSLPNQRQEALLQQFQSTRLPSGLWGLHEKSSPYVFVTSLVYVAARLLGVPPNNQLLQPAGEFIRSQGGVISIPTWGKFWLAMLNLYDWCGVNPTLPEVWLLPKQLPIHPSKYYCHTRLIYLGMAYVYGRKFQVPLTPIIQELRSELYLQEYNKVNFAVARTILRSQEVYSPPGFILKAFYSLATVYDRWHFPNLRERVLSQMLDQIRWELQATHYTSISPVSGLLNLIALWLHDPNDVDRHQALKSFEGWIWEDQQQGLRITGARSSTWDTSFVVQALQAASPHVDVASHIEKGRKFLASQQIRKTFPNFAENDRIDPKGGFCFAGVWHGWPVSDCTAEALLALLETPEEMIPESNLEDAVHFLLRCQNEDGGFGSYEPQKIPSTLEWINPAEMFANSMTERSYIECTASCLAALAQFRCHYPNKLENQLKAVIERAQLWLRGQQRLDGSWPGFWGVNFIYGTMFGMQGLLAAGTPTYDPAIRRACNWLIDKQKPDGGWGEHFQGCLTKQYVEHHESQVIQTAWALKALLEAKSSAWAAIEAGVQFLAQMQLDNGQWLHQDPAGVFFSTALLDYTLYRSYFPIWALSLYESRRQERITTVVP
ncbi:MAG: 2,3-oxidosqualene cyclase [Moorea sp. SIOASIH]|uniref:prenyltransferase/squalene oxidase repeat-containing protein n=1 Tax=Moorena sp. SIOASIH TaxID=2607817 RepID=UPI0013B9A878|nr:prenyltransferase/squalene oxidase repeat-containing protein [Moorena sp. SIOASIH]NEO42105.1 2,3-oxidosqualene cyclase [Moorena sp. SIOASIH]